MNVNMSWRRASRALAMSAVLVLSMAAVDGAPPRYFKMKSVQVIDKGGFAKPTPAMDVLVPSDWTFEGGVQWANRGCFADLAAVTFKTTSPDGKIVIEAFPSFSWQAVDNPSVQRYLIAENQEGLKVGLKPCPVFGPVPAADVLRKRVIPQLRPGKEIAAMDTSADLDRAIGEMLDYDGPVLFDCVVEKGENCFPMIPSGAAHNEMLLTPDDGGEVAVGG